MKKKNVITVVVLVFIIGIAVTAVTLLSKDGNKEVETTEQDPHMYMAVNVFNREYGSVYSDIKATHVKSDKDVDELHYYILNKTDMQVELRVLGVHNYAVGPVTNIYGTDYSCVFFETDTVDHVSVYDFIYENTSKSVFVLKEDLTLVDLLTGEVFNYGEQSNTTGAGTGAESSEQ